MNAHHMSEDEGDQRSLEELQREKLMLEIEKLKQDMLAQDIRLKRESRNLVIAAIGGGTAFLVMAAAFGRLFFSP